MAIRTDDIAAFRRFNRMYTSLIGTLDEGMLRTPYSLAEARTIYELATRPDPNAKEIADVLAMDPGYLSRILAKLETAGVLKRKASKHDNRRADLALTPRGKIAFQKLDSLSDDQARGILDNLPPADRARLILSIKTVEDLLAKSDQPVPPFILRPHRIGDMGWIVHQEGIAYAQEFGWDETFEGLVARIVADFIANFDPRIERCWIAEIDHQPVGHIFLVKHPERPDTAKLRLLYVDSAARGKGLGHALVNECVSFARTAGYAKITLWTQSVLAAAHRIYANAGFRMVHQEAHRSFGKDLIGQTWELDLVPPSTKPSPRRRTKPPRA
jgi:DNA-binding MarR family transcriptional regulator/GNAT superfamily N-acetyltransferase